MYSTSQMQHRLYYVLGSGVKTKLVYLYIKCKDTFGTQQKTIK